MHYGPVDPVAELTNFLHRLDLLRDDVQRVLTALDNLPQANLISDEPASTAALIDRSSLPRPVSRHPSVSPERRLTGPFQLGDHVLILNPRPHQQSSGLIIGLTPSIFYQVRTPNGSVVSRIARNLRLRPN